MPSFRRTRSNDSDAAGSVAAPPPSTLGSVGRFMLTSLVALAAFAAIVIYHQRQVGHEEAVRNARETAVQIGRGIVGPLVTEDVLRGDPQAVASFDEVVRERVLDDRIVRIKIWSEDGEVIYSDKKELIGRVFAVENADRKPLRDGEARAEVSDVSGPDDVYERDLGKLLEVYYPLTTAGGQRVLVESYERLGGVTANAGRIWLKLAPMLLGAMALLWLLQGPLAWSMARRLERGHAERERLLANAVDASAAERRRIAADLHDGVVQRLAGTAYALAATADSISSTSDDAAARSLRESILVVRQSIRELRSLIVEIHPPNLTTQGLAPALQGLFAPLSARSIDARLDVSKDLRSSPDVEKLVYRAAQEALRNVVAHSNATRVVVSVGGDDRRARLTVDDDGRGLEESEATPRSEDGHVGLALLADLANTMGGSLHVGPGPNGGTRMLLEVPQS